MTKPYYTVERRGTDERGWYQVMLSPFKTFDECLKYINKYKDYYPNEHRNYKITCEV